MLRVLITGSNGFLGSALKKYLTNHPLVSYIGCLTRRKGTEFNCIDNKKYIEVIENIDLTDSIKVENVFSKTRPDVVFHLAAQANNSDSNVVKDNILTTANLLQCCNKTRFIFASTCNVYGDKYGILKAEENSKTDITSMYAASKLACEALIEASTSLGEIDSLILRYVGIVGPNMTHGALKHIIEKMNGPDKHIKVFGMYNGSTKNYIHIDDAVEITANFGLDPRIKGIINISANETVPIESILQFIKENSVKAFNKTWEYTGIPWLGDNLCIKVDNFKMKHFINRLRYSFSIDAVKKAILQNIEK